MYQNSNLFQCVIQTTSRSALVSLAAPAVQRAPWCTSSSGSPRAGSSPPQPYQYDSPNIRMHNMNLNQNQLKSYSSRTCFVGTTVKTSHYKTAETNADNTSPPDEWLLTSQSDWTLGSWTG